MALLKVWIHRPRRRALVSQKFAFDPDKARQGEHRTIAHRQFDWGLVRADIVKRTGLRRQETTLAAATHAFLFNLQGAARVGQDFVDGRRITFTPRPAGSVIFLPLDSEWSGWDEGDANGTYLCVSMDAGFVEETLGRHYLSALRPQIGFRNPMIETSLHRIASELKNPDATSVIMVESQAVQILVHLARRNGIAKKPLKGGFSPFDLKRVTALMETRLSVPPAPDELAGEIGVSRRHFFRAFKQSTGKSPAAYMADLRLKRALDLLRATNRPVTEIALECGFSSSSHFAYAFKRVHGVSPLEYRRRWHS